MASQLNLSSPRIYRGRPAATTLIRTQSRVPVQGSRVNEEVLKPQGSRLHQSSRNQTFAFVPNPTFQCCKRKRCMAYFTSASDARVLAARQPLYTMKGAELREELHANWREHLTIEADGKTLPVCVIAATKIYCVSKSLLYPDQRPRPSRS